MADDFSPMQFLQHQRGVPGQVEPEPEGEAWAAGTAGGSVAAVPNVAHNYLDRIALPFSESHGYSLVHVPRPAPSVADQQLVCFHAPTRLGQNPEADAVRERACAESGSQTQ